MTSQATIIERPFPPRRPGNLKQLRSQTPDCAGADHLELGTVLRTDTGRVALAYLHVPGAANDLRPHLQGAKFARPHPRGSGTMTTTLVYGFMPRVVYRADWCHASEINRDWPAFYERLNAWGPVLEDEYRRWAPETMEHHEQQAERIGPDWRLPGCRVYSGGVVNKNSMIGYHTDAGNIAETYSSMLGIRDGVTGGHLHLPEYGLCLPVHDGSLTIFNGQAAIHGVTPFHLLRPSAHRYTIVYYTLASLWNCLPVDDELERSRKVMTERQRRRARGEVGKLRRSDDR